MHAISFLLKRAYLATRGAGQRLLYDVPGMTPARFDILCFARQWPIRIGVEASAYTTQRRIREALGISAPVISRMLRRLEELKWIERELDAADRRVKVVVLTPLGLRKIWEAMRRIFRGRALLKHFEMLARYLRPTDHVLEALDHVFETLDFIALGFGDTSEFRYGYGSPRHTPYYRSLPRTRAERKEPYATHETVDGFRLERDQWAPRLTPYQRWVAPLRKPVDPDPNHIPRARRERFPDPAPIEDEDDDDEDDWD